MRYILLLLAVLALAPEALARESVWKGDRLVVYDHSSEQWRPIVEAEVAAWASVLPRRAPKVSYRAGDQTDCDHMPRRTDAIVVCSRDNADYPGTTVSTFDHGYIIWAKVIFDDTWFSTSPENTVCQELGHAILNMQDRDSYTDIPSCVWGILTTPGPVDVSYAKRAYRYRHQSKHHH